MRFYWQCSWENGASDWRDHEACRARSKKAFPSIEAAEKAGSRHEHPVNVYALAKRKRYP